MKLSEALEVQTFPYESTRDGYNIHDPTPSVLIIDKNYNVDRNGKSVLGFNLNYLDNLTRKQKEELVNKINKVDNKVLNIGAVKAWLRSIFNIGDYERISVEKRIKRYNKIVKEFPELKRIIRRYKMNGIKGKIR